MLVLKVTLDGDRLSQGRDRVLVATIVALGLKYREKQVCPIYDLFSIGKKVGFDVEQERVTGAMVCVKLVAYSCWKRNSLAASAGVASEASQGLKVIRPGY